MESKENRIPWLLRDGTMEMFQMEHLIPKCSRPFVYHEGVQKVDHLRKNKKKKLVPMDQLMAELQMRDGLTEDTFEADKLKLEKDRASKLRHLNQLFLSKLEPYCTMNKTPINVPDDEKINPDDLEYDPDLAWPDEADMHPRLPEMRQNKFPMTLPIVCKYARSDSKHPKYSSQTDSSAVFLSAKVRSTDGDTFTKCEPQGESKNLTYYSQTDSSGAFLKAIGRSTDTSAATKSKSKVSEKIKTEKDNATENLSKSEVLKCDPDFEAEVLDYKPTNKKYYINRDPKYEHYLVVYDATVEKSFDDSCCRISQKLDNFPKGLDVFGSRERKQSERSVSSNAYNSDNAARRDGVGRGGRDNFQGHFPQQEMGRSVSSNADNSDNAARRGVGRGSRGKSQGQQKEMERPVSSNAQNYDNEARRGGVGRGVRGNSKGHRQQQEIERSVSSPAHNNDNAARYDDDRRKGRDKHQDRHHPQEVERSVSSTNTPHKRGGDSNGMRNKVEQCHSDGKSNDTLVKTYKSRNSRNKTNPDEFNKSHSTLNDDQNDFENAGRCPSGGMIDLQVKSKIVADAKAPQGCKVVVDSVVVGRGRGRGVAKAKANPQCPNCRCVLAAEPESPELSPLPETSASDYLDLQFSDESEDCDLNLVADRTEVTPAKQSKSNAQRNKRPERLIYVPGKKPRPRITCRSGNLFPEEDIAQFKKDLPSAEEQIFAAYKLAFPEDDASDNPGFLATSYFETDPYSVGGLNPQLLTEIEPYVDAGNAVDVAGYESMQNPTESPSQGIDETVEKIKKDIQVLALLRLTEDQREYMHKAAEILDRVAPGHNLQIPGHHLPLSDRNTSSSNQASARPAENRLSPEAPAFVHRSPEYGLSLPALVKDHAPCTPDSIGPPPGFEAMPTQVDF